MSRTTCPTSVCNMDFNHLPVMPDECVDALNIKPDGIYADATTGGAGHSLLIAEKLTSGRLICFDRDNDALAAAKQRLNACLGKVTFVKSNFEDIKLRLEELDIPHVDGVLFDLGVSSFQLDTSARGFSYMADDAFIDMRMDADQALTAYDVVNSYSRDQLRGIISGYGEERWASSIASAIERRRAAAPIRTTSELVEVIKSAMPASALREKQHPAKRTFQAIRIEVNGELTAVQKAVDDSIDCLRAGGRIAVISFHSLEDRIVKNIFARRAKGCTCPKEFPVCVCGKTPQLKLISKGVITAGESELKINPRSRSAKLRIGEKL